MTNDSIDTSTLVRTFYAPLSTGDTSVLDEVLASDWQAVPALRTGAGPAGWVAGIEFLRGVFTDLTVDIEDLVIGDDLVAVRSVNRGIHTGTLLGVPGTGIPVEFRAADFHRIEAGRITRSWHLEDYFGIATQLGLSFT